MGKDFERRLRMMYSRDGMTAEDGFGDLLACAEEHAEDLVAAFRAELTSAVSSKVFGQAASEASTSLTSAMRAPPMDQPRHRRG